MKLRNYFFANSSIWLVTSQTDQIDEGTKLISTSVHPSHASHSSAQSDSPIKKLKTRRPINGKIRRLRHLLPSPRALARRTDTKAQLEGKVEGLPRKRIEEEEEVCVRGWRNKNEGATERNETNDGGGACGARGRCERRVNESTSRSGHVESGGYNTYTTHKGWLAMDAMRTTLGGGCCQVCALGPKTASENF